MLFVDAGRILAWNIFRRFANNSSVIINRPTGKHVTFGRRSRRSNSRAARSLYDLTRWINLAHARAIRSYCIFYSYVIFFPLGVHGVVLSAVTDQVFVRGDLNRRKRMCHIRAVRTILISNEKIRQRSRRAVFLDAFDPAQELIACAGRRIGDRNRFVDLNIRRSGIRAGFTIDIPVPIDEGLDFLVLLNEDSLENNGIGIMCVRIQRIILISRNGLTGIRVDNLGIVDLDVEDFAGVHTHAGIYIFSSVPVLHGPMAEDVGVRIVCGTCAGRNRLGLIDVVVVIRRGRPSALVREVVLDLDALGANQLAAPFGIQRNLAVGGGPIGLTVIRITVLRDIAVVYRNNSEVVAVGEFRICKPTDQLPVIALCTGHVGDVLVAVYVEVLALIRVDITDRISCGAIGNELYVVDLCQPLRVKLEVVRRHRAEGVRLRAVDVLVPTREHITVHRRSEIVVGSVDILLVLDAGLGIDVLGNGRIRERDLLRGATVVNQIKECAIFILDRILVADVVHKDVSRTCVIPTIISSPVRAIYWVSTIVVVISLRIILGRKTGICSLGEAIQRNVILWFCKDAILGIYCFILHKASPVVCTGGSLARQHLSHIVDSFRVVT